MKVAGRMAAAAVATAAKTVAILASRIALPLGSCQLRGNSTSGDGDEADQSANEGSTDGSYKSTNTPGKKKQFPRGKGKLVSYAPALSRSVYPHVQAVQG